MVEFDEVRLNEAPLTIIDGDRGNNYPKQNDFSSEGFCLFLSATNVTKSGFSFEVCQFISKERDELLRKGRLERHDVIVTTRGTVGNVAYYDDFVAYDHIRINSGMLILRADRRLLSPNWTFARNFCANGEKCQIEFPEGAQADSLKQPTCFQIGKRSSGANLSLSGNQVAFKDRCKVTSLQGQLTRFHQKSLRMLLPM